MSVHLSSAMVSAGPQTRLASTAKAVLAGTHRVCPPEETLARIRPMLPQFGITRVADITRLDHLGLPVIQAVRPNSRNLAVSQGKGISKALATVSALMEAIELWYAEDPQLLTCQEEIGALAPSLPYALSDLALSKQHLLHDALRLEWFPAQVLGSTEQTFVPADLVRLNFTLQATWVLPAFSVSSNGLASGNVLEEAIVHGLYEVIERDALARAQAGVVPVLPIDLPTVDGPVSRQVLDQLQRAGATVEVAGLLAPTDVPCFEARLSSAGYPTVIKGSGCHLDRDVALSRALTEAAQVRLSVVAGARDDIGQRAYIEVRQMRSPTRISGSAARVPFQRMPSCAQHDLDADLALLIGRLQKTVPSPPWWWI